MDKTRHDKLRVYISSTYSDLREYRDAVTSTLLRFGLEPIMLESFSYELPEVVALTTLESSDIVILIVAYRIGYVPRDGNKSLVELEYERAHELAKPTLCFVLDDNQPWPRNLFDVDPTQINAFRELLMQNETIVPFTTPDDLAAKVALSISQYSRYVEAVPVEPPPLDTREVTPTSTDQIMTELKAMRAEFLALQQVVDDFLRRSSNAGSIIGEHSNINSAEFLGSASRVIDPNLCFVIMPYSQKWSAAVERIILEVCGALELEFLIAKNMEGRFIPNDIWRGITGAGVIIADLSGANANVTYEVGLADVIGKEVILIAQQANVPFDFHAQRIILYEDSLPGSLTLREELKDRLQRYKAKIKDIDHGN